MRTKWKALSRLFPLGWPWENECLLTAAAWFASAIAALCIFLYRSDLALRSLYDFDYPAERILIPGRLMPPYPAVLGNALLCFWLTALCLVLLIPLHFLWHRRGSRSDYLMRRLPRQRELARRCAAGTAALLAGTALTAAVLFFLLFFLYQALTPAGCLPPDVWAVTGG